MYTVNDSRSVGFSEGSQSLNTCEGEKSGSSRLRARFSKLFQPSLAPQRSCEWGPPSPSPDFSQCTGNMNMVVPTVIATLLQYAYRRILCGYVLFSPGPLQPFLP